MVKKFHASFLCCAQIKPSPYPTSFWGIGDTQVHFYTDTTMKLFLNMLVVQYDMKACEGNRVYFHLRVDFQKNNIFIK